MQCKEVYQTKMNHHHHAGSENGFVDVQTEVHRFAYFARSLGMCAFGFRRSTCVLAQEVLGEADGCWGHTVESRCKINFAGCRDQAHVVQVHVYSLV
jgi:hypothetical protein